jgi:hypothetical protein
VWCRRRFFLPVRVLSRLFRGKLLAALRGAVDDGRLQLADHPAFEAVLEPQPGRGRPEVSLTSPFPVQ